MKKYKIFVISLLLSENRRNHIIKIFGNAGINFEFIDAVYGKELHIENDTRINYAEVKKHPDWLTPNMLGCSLSHIKAYQKTIDEKLDFAVIFEDDVLIDSQIDLLISSLSEKLDINGAVLLYYQCWDEIILGHNKKDILFDTFYMYDVSDKYRLTSTAGYAITQEACITMLLKTIPLHVGPDSWQYFYQSGAIKSLKIIHPMPVSTFEFQSTISSLTETEKGGLKNIIIKIIESYKIPLLYTLLQKRRRKNKLNVQKIKEN